MHIEISAKAGHHDTREHKCTTLLHTPQRHVSLLVFHLEINTSLSSFKVSAEIANCVSLKFSRPFKILQKFTREKWCKVETIALALEMLLKKNQTFQKEL